MTHCRALAKRFGMWLSLGGLHERPEGEIDSTTKMFNSHFIVDSAGDVRARYQKVHLFDVSIPGGPVLNESSGTEAGNEMVVVDSPVGRLGLATCYDLRFPELFQGLTRAGAQILLVPSAFTAATGKDHWEVLLRARAIENQCYVIAAAQVGRHNEKRYGKIIFQFS